MAIWAHVQTFASQSVQKRVRLALRSRWLRNQAESRLAQGIHFLEAEANDPGEGLEEFPPESLGGRLRSLKLDEVLDYPLFEREEREIPGGVAGAEVRLRVYPRRSYTPSPESEKRDCRSFAAAIEGDLKQYHEKWSELPG